MRAYRQTDFTGENTGREICDRSLIMHPKLFYMAVFSEDFKFINQFEFKVILGDTAGSGIGVDGTTFFRIKNFQTNFTLWIIRLFDRITAEDA